MWPSALFNHAIYVRIQRQLFLFVGLLVCLCTRPCMRIASARVLYTDCTVCTFNIANYVLTALTIYFSSNNGLNVLLCGAPSSVQRTLIALTLRPCPRLDPDFASITNYSD